MKNQRNNTCLSYTRISNEGVLIYSLAAPGSILRKCYNDELCTVQKDIPYWSYTVILEFYI
jgi:hypothetical protein